MQHNIPGPNFAKTSFRRSTSYNHNGAINQEILAPKEPTDQVASKHKLRYVQMEQAEKEACKLLRVLCLDASQNLANTDGDFEINDLLTGILLLGNMCKRMAHAKKTTESTMENMKSDYTNILADKDIMITQLEGVILKLRDETVKAADHLTELNIKHENKMIMLTKELATTKETYLESKTEIQRLHMKISTLERRIMEIPRLEEKYMRTARGIVRNQEVLTTQKEIGFKKIVEDVKTLAFYKNKAINLEETLSKQKNDIENYATQARVALSKYQTLLTTYNAEKRATRKEGANNNSRPQSAPTHKRTNTMKVNGMTITSDNEFIPSSNSKMHSQFTGTQNKTTLSRNMAKMRGSTNNSSMYSASAHAYSTNDIANLAAKVASDMEQSDSDMPFTSSVASPHKPSTPHRALSPSQQQQNGRTSPIMNGTPQNNKPSKKVSMDLTVTIDSPLGNTKNSMKQQSQYLQQTKTLEETQAELITKLRYEAAQKDAHIIKLSRKLSYARAYPLYSLENDEITYDTTHTEHVHMDDRMSVQNDRRNSALNFSGGGMHSSSMHNLHGSSNNKSKAVYNYKGSGKENIKAFFSSLDDMDLDSVSSEYLSTEQTLLNKRFDDAIEMEREYQHRVTNTKSRNAPNIEAIRNSRSFAKPKEIYD